MYWKYLTQSIKKICRCFILPGSPFWVLSITCCVSHSWRWWSWVCLCCFVSHFDNQTAIRTVFVSWGCACVPHVFLALTKTGNLIWYHSRKLVPFSLCSVQPFFHLLHFEAPQESFYLAYAESVFLDLFTLTMHCTHSCGSLVKQFPITGSYQYYPS